MENSVPKKSWFSRNWPWAVPLGGCLTLIVVLVILFGAMIFGVSKVFTGTVPYQEGVEMAKQDEYLQKVLGEPIEADGMMSGEISTSNGSGIVDISIPIKGPDGEATIYITGTKENDKWTYSKVDAVIKETNESVDLLWGEGEKIKENTFN
ncbi:hypothetical protein GCM10022393_16880 [Aquimarina addita]|uniref:Cytochrome oxidase complex assembly protein 1 n=1 Tax=Aquimarina addita TaxID=870485 RepID=A0ABP7XHW7_9FLAO